MTLFKKVFGNQSVEFAEGMIDAKSPEVEALEDADIAARVARLAASASPDTAPLDRPVVVGQEDPLDALIEPLEDTYDDDDDEDPFEGYDLTEDEDDYDADDEAYSEASSLELMPDEASRSDDNTPEEITAKTPPRDVDSEPEVLGALSMAQRAALAQQQIQMSQRKIAAETQKPAVSTRSVPVVTDAAEDFHGEQAFETATPTSPQARPGRGAGARRARTRLLGFDQGNDVSGDPIEKASEGTRDESGMFPVGWFVIVSGPGKGNAIAIYNGASTVGRGEDQAIKLDFGDSSISRQNHAAVAYDDEQNKFYLGHGGKSNIIRLNGRPVLSTESLTHADLIRIGETTLRFVALCGTDFKWEAS